MNTFDALRKQLPISTYHIYETSINGSSGINDVIKIILPSNYGNIFCFDLMVVDRIGEKMDKLVFMVDNTNNVRIFEKTDYITSINLGEYEVNITFDTARYWMLFGVLQITV